MTSHNQTPLCLEAFFLNFTNTFNSRQIIKQEEFINFAAHNKTKRACEETSVHFLSKSALFLIQKLCHFIDINPNSGISGEHTNSCISQKLKHML